MKRCPRCRRDYHDDTLSFCLADGAKLVYGLEDHEPATAILHETAPPNEAATKAPIHTTDASGSHRSSNRRTTLIAGLLAIVLLAGAGYLGYRYVASSSKQSGAKQLSSIAVVPFANSTGDAASEYLSDGISEGIINSLSKIDGLRVVPRSTVFRLKGQSLDPGETGQKLNVDAVLTGRVVQRGDVLDVQAELIDVSQNSQLWGQQYIRKISEVQTLQNEISKQILQKLRGSLTGEQERHLSGDYTTQGEAYQEYLKGVYARRGQAAESNLEALTHFNRAVAIDPNFAAAYAGIASAYADMSSQIMAPSEAMPKAKDAAIKALSLDPTLADVHVSLAEIYWWGDWDYARADTEFKRAIELSPNEPGTFARYANFLGRLLRFEEAEAAARRTIDLDPASAGSQATLLRVYFFARRYDDLVERGQEVVAAFPDSTEAHYFLGLGYLGQGKNQDAIAELRRAATEVNNLSALGHAYAVTGRRDEALKVIDQIRSLSEKKKFVPPYEVARVLASLGEKEEAFSWLQKAFEVRDDGLTRMKIDPFMDNIRDDRRYAELMQRVGLQ